MIIVGLVAVISGTLATALAVHEVPGHSAALATAAPWPSRASAPG